MSRLRVVVFAAAPAIACVSGAADSFDGPGGGNGQAGSGFSGSPTHQAGSSSVSGSGQVGSAGTPTGAGGTVSTAGTGTTQGGAVSAAGTSNNGGAGGTKTETCSYPAWAAMHDYKKGDKVMYQGKAFIANDDNPGYDPLISTFYWSPYDCQAVSMGGSGGSGGSGMVINNGDCVLDKLLPQGETTFHSMFIPPWQGHQEKSLYNYSALCTALKGFGQFAASGNAEADKREIAAFFAHVAKETAFLEQTDEAGQSSTSGDFHGRGAIQLTGQANYQAAGDYLQKNLVGSPGMVSTDAVTNWQTALWFWVVHNNPGTAGTKNCHQAIQAGDFAQTTRIINGGIECPGSESAKTRANYYTNNCGLLSVSPGSNLVC
jgi:predicted chitinase